MKELPAELTNIWLESALGARGINSTQARKILDLLVVNSLDTKEFIDMSNELIETDSDQLEVLLKQVNTAHKNAVRRRFSSGQSSSDIPGTLSRDRLKNDMLSTLSVLIRSLKDPDYIF